MLVEGHFVKKVDTDVKSLSSFSTIVLPQSKGYCQEISCDFCENNYQKCDFILVNNRENLDTTFFHK